MQLITVEAVALTHEAWAPFGWLPVADTDARDRDHDLHFAWDDPHLNVISHSSDEVRRTAQGTRCDVMYRHDTHTQALVPLDGPAVLAVAAAAVDFSEPDDVHRVRAFVLQPLDAFVLHRGTWHWGPFPLGAAQVRLLNVQGARYAEDNAAVDLPARTGRALDVVVP